MTKESLLGKQLHSSIFFFLFKEFALFINILWMPLVILVLDYGIFYFKGYVCGLTQLLFSQN